MVMHASKHPRLSDGFHDKNEAHAYEMDKYPHKARDSVRDSRDSRDSRDNRDSRDRKDRDRNVKESPRGVHQESPRNNADKSYGSKSRSRGSSGSKHSNNQAMYKPNSHSAPDPEKRLKEMLARANDWTMHTSSSGKKYYYNCKTEVSQWEKPKEWMEKEALEKAIGGKLPASGSHSNVKTTPSKDRGNDKHSSKSRSQPQQQQQQQQPYRTQDRTSLTLNQSESWRQSVQAGHSQRRYSNSQSQSKLNQSSQSENSRSHPSQGSVRQSDHSKNNLNEDEIRKESGSRLNDNDTHQNAHQQHSPSLNRRLSEGNGTDQVQRDSPSYQKGRPLSTSLATDMYGRLKNLVTPVNSVGKRDRNESPKVNSSPSSNVSTVSPLPTTSPKIVRTPMQNQQQRWRKSSSRSPVSHHHVDVKEELPQKFSNPSPMSIASVSDLSSPARSYPSPDNSTPLSNSSNQPDKSRVEKMEVVESKDVEPPDKLKENSKLSENDVVNSSQILETKELSENSVDPINKSLEVEPIHEPPVTKPKEDEFQFKEIIFSAESHLNYFSEDLIKHKTNLPVEQLEKQAHQVQRDSYRLGVENYSQVMMDLKFARSLVRTTEIQANVQASRIVFLRQQVKELEKLKNENAYMT